jgi:type II secretory pathway pseudopilin PulG
VPPNLQRFLPVLLIGVVLLFVLPAVLKKKSASGSSSKTQAAQTIDAANLIDQAEQSYRLTHGRFTTHLADLVPLHPRLATDLGIGLAVTLDTGTGGQSYLQQIRSGVLSLVRVRNRDKVAANSCLVVKSASGVTCPAPRSRSN